MLKRVEQWECGSVTIVDYGNGTERIHLPSIVVTVGKKERGNRQILHVSMGGGITYRNND